MVDVGFTMPKLPKNDGRKKQAEVRKFTLVFNSRTLKAALKRADVVYVDNDITMTRFVVSRNVEAPLTDDEKTEIEERWLLCKGWSAYRLEFK